MWLVSQAESEIKLGRYVEYDTSRSVLDPIRGAWWPLHNSCHTQRRHMNYLVRLNAFLESPPPRITAKARITTPSAAVFLPAEKLKRTPRITAHLESPRTPSWVSAWCCEQGTRSGRPCRAPRGAMTTHDSACTSCCLVCLAAHPFVADFAPVALGVRCLPCLAQNGVGIM